MSLTTYSGLQTGLVDLLNRTDLTSYIPDWIVMAEADLNTRLECRQMTNVSTITLTAETYALPTYFGGRTELRLNVNQGIRLTYLTPDLLDDITTTAGRPESYSIIGENFYFAPPPDGTYTARLKYRQKLTPLSDDAPSNWLSLAYPHAYLYGAAIHSAPFLRDDPRLSTWAGLYQSIVDQINLESRRESEGSTLQTTSGFYG